MRSLLLSVALLSFAACVVAKDGLADASDNSRVALVIGNGAYQHSPRLNNPAHDAQGVGDLLTKLGFTVIERENLTREQLKGTLKQFYKILRPGGVAMLYYSGHGVQIDGRNYIMPIDPEYSSALDVGFGAIDVADILKVLNESKTDTNIIVLDACRDNPFNTRSAGQSGWSINQAPTGTLISYSTEAGSTADDGIGRYGTYTEQFLKIVSESGPTDQAELVFRRVRVNVLDVTNGAQRSAESTNLVRDFVFRQQKIAAANATVTEALVTASLPIVARSADVSSQGNVEIATVLPIFGWTYSGKMLTKSLVTGDHNCTSNCRGEPTKTYYQIDLNNEAPKDHKLDEPQLVCAPATPTDNGCPFSQVAGISSSADKSSLTAKFAVWSIPTRWTLSAKIYDWASVSAQTVQSQVSIEPGKELIIDTPSNAKDAFITGISGLAKDLKVKVGAKDPLGILLNPRQSDTGNGNLRTIYTVRPPT